jgi:C1A family cysteine protease
MKLSKSKSVLGFWLSVFSIFVVSLVLFLSLPDVTNAGKEEPIRFSQDDSMNSLRMKIQEMREEIKRNGYTFEVGINSAMQYPLEELCTLDPNLKPGDSCFYENNGQEIEGYGIDRVEASTLPSYYIGYYSPIKDTGSCGCGWAFVTTGVLEGIIKKKDGITVDLSEQYLIDCNTSGYNCGIGWFCHYMHMAPYGARLESCYPYTGTQGPCNPNNCPWVYRISNWGYVGNGSSVPSVSAIKQKIYDYGSVAALVYADSYFQAYTAGCFNHNATGSPNLFIILVGWDDSRCTTGAWRLKNYWGTGWGEAGFMWIKYGVCRVGYAANYVVYP